MTKLKRQYVCQSCGTLHLKWSGQCSACLEWNTLTEEIVSKATHESLSRATTLTPIPLNAEIPVKPRIQSGLFEFDRVCGGGLVPGSVTLIGGDPGIGKSTLMLQVCEKLAQNHAVLYVSGEEAEEQIRLRAQRLGVTSQNIQLLNTTHLEDIRALLKGSHGFSVVIIDSIQTINDSALESAAGTVSQVRHCSLETIKMAKSSDTCVIFIGHVTKDGTIAGPRVLEHMVDAVLTFEGDRSHQYRILRGLKNRFGATDELGVFAMQGQGLIEVVNPSALFLEERQAELPGSAVFAGMEGTRPLLVEIQALVLPSTFAAPRRAVVGWDNNRLNMILAVLEARAGLKFSDKEVYLNIVGGLKIVEPAADLAVAAALVSALLKTPLPTQTVCFGEIGLTGEIRRVPYTEARLKEAAKLGFSQAWVPDKARVEGAALTQQGLSTINQIRQKLS